MSTRTFDTVQRKDWNAKIHNILKTIDLHTELLLKTGDQFHYIQANILRLYVAELKDWIFQQEKNSEKY
jgi:hypothetical protein